MYEPKTAKSVEKVTTPVSRAAHKASSHNPTWAQLAMHAQPKLRVGPPGDEYERDADRTAEQVLTAPIGTVQRTCDAGGIPNGKDHSMIQSRSKSPGEDSVAGTDLGATTSLPHAMRSDFEHRFGADFRNVRIATGPEAASAAAGLNARAFTLGSHIAFGAGEYSPESTTGQRLLAHELTHVLQQNGHVIRRIPAELIDNYSFIGNTVGGGLNKTLKGRLEKVEETLKTQYDAIPDASAEKVNFGGTKKTFKEWAGIYSVRSWRPGSSTSKHASGSAVDVNYDLQPYIATRTIEGDKPPIYGGEAAGASLQAERKAATEVYDRATQFTTNTKKEADISARKPGESARAAYDRVRALDQALSYYFRFAFLEDPKEVNRKPIKDIEGASEEDLLKTIPTTERRDLTDAVASLEWWMNDAAWKDAHPAWPYTPRQMYFRILRDYEHVRIPMVKGKPVARPDITRNPTRGFLYMRPEFVVAMIDVGKLRWGAVDLGSGESGDVHHFDLGNHGGVTPDGTE